MPTNQADAGVAVLDPTRLARGYRLNKMAMSLIEPANRQAFLADEAGTMRAHGLTEAEIDMVRRRDWPALIDHGGNVYLMLKIAGTVGVSVLQMGAAMRGGR
jgi:protocatechuate 4,5-dioxygenase alpha chain